MRKKKREMGERKIESDKEGEKKEKIEKKKGRELEREERVRKKREK